MSAAEPRLLSIRRIRSSILLMHAAGLENMDFSKVVLKAGCPAPGISISNRILADTSKAASSNGDAFTPLDGYASRS